MKWLFVAFFLAYPLLVYAGLAWLDARLIWLFVGTVLLLRSFAARERLPLLRRGLFLPILCLGAGAALIGALSNDPRSLFLVPALVNLSLLATFGATLWKGPSLVETLARLQTEELSPAEIAYCRSVTRLWCGFFLLNAAAIAAFALWGTAAQWTAYTGLVSYLLVGLLFASEYVYRHYRFRRYLGAPTDALLRRLFPPREAPGGPR
ncbi:MAG: hypothetical protein IPK67_15285 [Planctomycetes bacterium]|nr:hypothetical protein [Planctomycetota bacterium]